MLEAILEASQLLLTIDGLALLMLGTLVGVIVAVIPGLGAPVALAVMLPVTFTMTPSQALMFLLPIIGAGGFAGSQTAILLGVPGDSTNAATALDGYEMAKQGRAGEAIGASATASVIGALVGVVVLTLSIPFVRGVILAIGPEELFLAALFGVLLVGSLSERGEGRLRGILSGLLGISLGMVGYNYAFGGTRFVFGIPELASGIPIVPALVGLFALPEAMLLLKKGSTIGSRTPAVGDLRKGIMAAVRRPFVILRGALIGTGIGVIPGIGGSVTCWVAYSAGKRSAEKRTMTSDEPPFGRGNIDGVIAPESAVNAGDGGQLMPLLALGIPGGISTAVLAGAFLLHGIQPGPVMFTSQLHLVYVMVFAVVFANVVSALMGLSLGRFMMRITSVPFYIIAPLVMTLGAIGAVAAIGSIFGLWVFIAFGVLGYFMERSGYSRAALIVGLILTPIIERNLFISLQSNRGAWDWLYTRPGTLMLLGGGLLALLVPGMLRRRRRRRVQALADTANRNVVMERADRR